MVKSFACDCFFKLICWISSQGHKHSEALKHQLQQGTQAQEASAPGRQNVLSNLHRERETKSTWHSPGCHFPSFGDTFTKWRCFHSHGLPTTSPRPGYLREITREGSALSALQGTLTSQSPSASRGHLVSQTPSVLQRTSALQVIPSPTDP